MPTALITGASGFLGKYLVAHLRKAYPDLKIVALCLNPVRFDGVQTIVCDLSQPDSFQADLHKLEPDWVFHLAGTARISADISMPEYFSTNFLTTIGLLRGLEKISKPIRLFFASSVHVYGNREGEVDESSEPQPIGDYGFTKYLAEEAIRQEIHKRPNLSAVVGRLYSCIGPGQPAGFVASDLVRSLADLPPGAALKTGPLEGFRSFTDVRDMVAILPKLLEWNAPQTYEVINVSSPHENTIRQMVQLLLQVSGKTVRLESSPSKENNPFLGLKLSRNKLVSIAPDLKFRPLEATLRDVWLSQRE